MKITNIEFSLAEAAAIYALAGAVLMEQGVTRKKARDQIEAMTPQNVLRLALGLPTRKRGGARLNTGNRKQKPE